MPTKLSPKRILCVEDDLDTCNLIKNVLQPYQFSCARSYAEAWQLYNSDKYSLIIIDYHLEDGNGLDLCERIRQEDFLTPVVFITGDPNFSESDARMAGGQRLITKGSPNFIDDLYSTAAGLAINVG